MTIATLPLAKITDRSLRQFAEGQSQNECYVLIELDLPEPKVELGSRSTGERGPTSETGRIRPFRIVPETEGEQQEKVRRTAHVRDFLTGLLGEPPTWLPAAHTFIAKVTPSQLRQVILGPHVLAVHPNRTPA